jgi:uncharacterized membrane protein
MSDIYEAPRSNVERPLESPALGGSIDETLAGRFSFDPFALIGEAFRLTYGVKGLLLVGGVLMVLASLAGDAIGLALSPTADGDVMLELQASLIGLIGSAIGLALQAPFTAGVFWVALRHVAGKPVAAEHLFEPLRQFAPLAALVLLSWVLIVLGLLAFVIPGIYLIIGYMLAVPVMIDKSYSPWLALETSRRVITRCWWRMLLTLLLLVTIGIVSVLFLLVPLIWTWPMGVLTIALIYRNLCGISNAAR